MRRRARVFLIGSKPWPAILGDVVDCALIGVLCWALFVAVGQSHAAGYAGIFAWGSFLGRNR